MSGDFIVRRAREEDAPVIARHRARMFEDMGLLGSGMFGPLVDETTKYLHSALGSGEYAGWLAAHRDNPGTIVAGAGVQQRRILPRPLSHDGTSKLVPGREAIILNVFTEPEWRKRGLARLLMEQVMAWARTSGIDTLVLHASADGRPLYEQLGFVQTNEMRFRGWLTR